MEQRLEDMFKLLHLWQQYVDVIYAPENEINILQFMKESGRLGAFDNEGRFTSKVKNEEIEKKLADLFAKDLDDLNEQVDTVKDAIDELYMTANEDQTTDTAITTDAGDNEVEQRSPIEKALNPEQQEDES